MLESHHVVTPTAFIMGQINISGMSGRGFSTEARVIAKANGQVTETTAKNVPPRLKSEGPISSSSPGFPIRLSE